MKHPLTLGVALALLAVASPARADYAPAWTYTWTAQPLSVLSDPPGTGSLSLTNDHGSAAGSTALVATSISAMSTASPGNPDQFVNGGQYKLFLAITDTASGQVGHFEIDGKLSGSISAGSSAVTSSFTSPLTTSFTLGSTVYTVTAENFLPPGPTGSSASGGIGAEVEVAPATPGGSPGTSGVGAPEPSSLLLCGLGAAGCTLAGWRRRRAAAR
jgi:hypothetical protein